MVIQKCIQFQKIFGNYLEVKMIQAEKLKEKIENNRKQQADLVYKECLDNMAKGIHKVLSNLPEDYTNDAVTVPLLVERSRMFQNWAHTNKKAIADYYNNIKSTGDPEKLRKLLYPHLTTACLDLLTQDIFRYGYTSVDFAYDEGNDNDDSILVLVTISWRDTQQENAKAEQIIASTTIV